jgi:hypothetical protein
MFANVGDGEFIDIARPAGADSIQDSRGVAVADFNEDGRLDLAINNNNARPTIYFNEVRESGNWLGVRVIGTRSNRDAIGARIRLTAGGKTMMRQVEAGTGYASQAMMAVHFGLGDTTTVDAIEINWPSGEVQQLDGTELDGMVNRIISIEEGAGALVAQR